MNKDLLIKVSFGISLFSIVVWTTLRMLHLSSFVPFLSQIALIATIVYTILIAIEIFTSSRIRGAEKIMWVVGFLFFNTIAGLLYFAIRRRYLITNFKILPI
jgi:hypothetical protein